MTRNELTVISGCRISNSKVEHAALIAISDTASILHNGLIGWSMILPVSSYIEFSSIRLKITAPSSSAVASIEIGLQQTSQSST